MATLRCSSPYRVEIVKQDSEMLTLIGFDTNMFAPPWSDTTCGIATPLHIGQPMPCMPRTAVGDASTADLIGHNDGDLELVCKALQQAKVATQQYLAV